MERSGFTLREATAWDGVCRQCMRSRRHFSPTAAHRRMKAWFYEAVDQELSTQRKRQAWTAEELEGTIELSDRTPKTRRRDTQGYIHSKVNDLFVAATAEPGEEDREVSAEKLRQALKYFTPDGKLPGGEQILPNGEASASAVDGAS